MSLPWADGSTGSGGLQSKNISGLYSDTKNWLGGDSGPASASSNRGLSPKGGEPSQRPVHSTPPTNSKVETAAMKNTMELIALDDHAPKDPRGGPTESSSWGPKDSGWGATENSSWGPKDSGWGPTENSSYGPKDSGWGEDCPKVFDPAHAADPALHEHKAVSPGKTIEQPTKPSTFPSSPPNPWEALAARDSSMVGKSKRSEVSLIVSDFEAYKNDGHGNAAPARTPNEARLLADDDSKDAVQPSHLSSSLGATPRPLSSAPGDGGLTERWFDSLQPGLDACDAAPLSPMTYPDTLKCPIEGPCGDITDIGWRHANMTSTLHIAREIKIRQGLGKRLRGFMMQQKLTQARAAAPVQQEEEESRPNAHCIVRPATPGDFGDILEILDQETSMNDHPQIFASKANGVKEINTIFHRCERNKQPFLVAVPVEEDLTDRSKWPKISNKAYREFLEFSKSRPKAPSAVVGFAYLCDIHSGTLGRSCSESRHSAQMHVLVDPRYRKLSYGTALMDRMLLHLSPFHRSVVDHEWKCSNRGGIYESPVTQNERQFARIYMEMFCETDDQVEYKWRAAMLGKFNFRQVARLHEVLRSGRRGERKWLDLVLWEFEGQLLSNIRDECDYD